MSIWISCLLAPPGDIGGGGGPGGGGDGGPPGCDCTCSNTCGGGCDEYTAFYCDKEKDPPSCATSSIPTSNIPGFDIENCEPPPKWSIDGTTYWAEGGKCDANADTGDCGIDCDMAGQTLYVDPLKCKFSEKNCNLISGGGGAGDGGPTTPGPTPTGPGGIAPHGYECGAGGLVLACWLRAIFR